MAIVPSEVGVIPVPSEPNNPEVCAREFLKEVYALAEAGEQRKAMRRIYAYFHDLRKRKELALCDRILLVSDEQRLTPVLLVAILTITAPVKTDLRERSAFYQRAKLAITAASNLDMAERTLVGLE